MGKEIFYFSYQQSPCAGSFKAGLPPWSWSSHTSAPRILITAQGGSPTITSIWKTSALSFTWDRHMALAEATLVSGLCTAPKSPTVWDSHWLSCFCCPGPSPSLGPSFLLRHSLHTKSHTVLMERVYTARNLTNWFFSLQHRKIEEKIQISIYPLDNLTTSPMNNIPPTRLLHLLHLMTLH